MGEILLLLQLLILAVRCSVLIARQRVGEHWQESRGTPLPLYTSELQAGPLTPSFPSVSSTTGNTDPVPQDTLG